MAWTLCTSGSAVAKAGLNFSGSAITLSGSQMLIWSNAAEGKLIGMTRRQWVSSYGTLQDGIKYMLEDACSDLIAIKIINYNIAANPSRISETMLDVLTKNSNEIMTALKDFDASNLKTPSVT